MRRQGDYLLPLTLLALVVAALLPLLAGCAGPYAPPPKWPAPPPVAPPAPPEPIPEPPAPPAPVDPPIPATPPADVAELLARITVGSTLTEATAAVGRAPVLVPASQAGPETARWAVAGFVAYAVIVDGRVARKGSTPVETPP